MDENDLQIPEIENPKTSMIGFKVNEQDKELVTEFCLERNYRVSAFCRVAVLSYIKEKLKDGK